MSWWIDLLQQFLLVFSALFSIVNPMGGALIFSQVTAARTQAQRADLARRIGIYAAMVMLGALWIGVYVLNFFGVTVDALRVAGGLVVAVNAWQLLSAPEVHEDRKQSHADEARTAPPDVAFFPLTMPLTTGPGTISVAIALGANRPSEPSGFLAFTLASTAAAGALALVIWIAYRWADTIVNLLGTARVQIVARLAAFLLLCIGVQITINGFTDALRHAGIGAS
ncbi:MarC family protein [Methylopila henanensis]|uniref:UPF0056 membrane protein n=1 Tax=Methylopila henanensis TaxID=873516 RepID=A0ABW4KB10_9HYPH